MEIDLFKPCEPRQQRDHAVAAVVPVSDGDAARVEQDEGGVDGGEAGGVGEAACAEEGG